MGRLNFYAGPEGDLAESGHLLGKEAGAEACCLDNRNTEIMS